jgi:hypothetical protein
MMSCGITLYPPEIGSLYRNEGSGKFTDVTRQSGLADAHGRGLGCIFCDFNGDGKPDLFIANDARPADMYRNLGAGRFQNVAVESGVAYGPDGQKMSGMGADAGDYDNNGRFDLVVANFAAQPKALFHNEGGLQFTDAAFSSGIGAITLRPLAFGAAFVDTENRGLLDIIFTNGHVQSLVERVDPSTSYRQSAQLLRNTGDGRFVDASAEAGPDFTRKIVGRGIAIGDYDGDGLLDLLVVDDEGKPLLLHNESRAGNHWVSLRCLTREGGPIAVGASVTIDCSRHRQIAEARASGSYLSTNAPEVHFGLGQAAKIDTLSVRWPDGHRSALREVHADRKIILYPGISREQIE